MIYFYKYQGAGNDFIMINNMDKSISLNGVEIKRLCDRHFGIGADGVIFLESSDTADCFMNYYNSDGTIAQMCGNGARCTAAFFLEQTLSSKMELLIDTRAGIKKVKCNVDGSFSVNMGKPVFVHEDFPFHVTTSSTCGGMVNFSFYGYELYCVSMGNPHAVTIVDDLNEIDIKAMGPKIENDYHFPNKINVEFVEKISDDYYKVAVWERGCGVTLACGTGACAVFVVLNKISSRQGSSHNSPRPCLGRKNNKEITLEFPGGKLFLYENNEGHIILRGSATFVFKGGI